MKKKKGRHQKQNKEFCASAEETPALATHKKFAAVYGFSDTDGPSAGLQELSYDFRTQITAFYYR